MRPAPRTPLRAPARLLTIPALLALTILTLLGPPPPPLPAPPATPAADAFPAVTPAPGPQAAGDRRGPVPAPAPTARLDAPPGVTPASGPQTAGGHRAPVPDLAYTASLEAREGGEATPGSPPADDSRAVPLAEEPWAGVRAARAAVRHEGHGERPAPAGPLTGAVPGTAPLQPGTGRADGPEGGTSSWSDQAATDHGRAPPATARA
ncbi:hypothetical protein ACWELO_27025 [Streptomyces sp. NPDC004596]